MFRKLNKPSKEDTWIFIVSMIVLVALTGFIITMGLDYYHDRDWCMIGLISVLTVILLGMMGSLIVSYLAYFKPERNAGQYIE